MELYQVGFTLLIITINSLNVILCQQSLKHFSKKINSGSGLFYGFANMKVYKRRKLNVTPIKSIVKTTIKQCVENCIREHRCISINIMKLDENEFKCELLDIDHFGNLCDFEVVEDTDYYVPEVSMYSVSQKMARDLQYALTRATSGKGLYAFL